MSAVLGPAPRPCESCPYRRDVPSGVWAAEEYEKLRAYDADTMYQPPGLFMCHQQDGRVCAGWCGTHDMSQSLGLRIAAHDLDEAVVLVCLDYTSPVPLFSSGNEAAEHGLTERESPGSGAQRLMAKIERRRAS